MSSSPSRLFGEPSAAEIDAASAETAQRLHASMRECRRLKVALTEAEEGWRDALSVAKSIQQKLKQREEEVQSLRTLLALTPGDRSAATTMQAPATPATSQQQRQWQQQQQHTQQHAHHSMVGDNCAECEQLRKAVNNLRGQLQVAIEEIGELKASCQLSPIEIEALKRESDVSQRQLDRNDHFLRSLADALAEQASGGAVVYAELASAVAELVDLASTLAACELGGLAVFMGQELQSVDEPATAASRFEHGRPVLGESVAQKPVEAEAQNSLQEQLQRIDLTNRRTTRLIQWIAAVTKYLRQQRVSQAVHVYSGTAATAAPSVYHPPTPAATVPAAPPSAPTSTPMVTRNPHTSTPAAPIQRVEASGNSGPATTPVMDQPAMLQRQIQQQQHQQLHTNQQQQAQQPPQQHAFGLVLAPDPPRLSQLRRASSNANGAVAAPPPPPAPLSDAAPRQSPARHPQTPPQAQGNGPSRSPSPSRTRALAQAEQQLHRASEVIRSISKSPHRNTPHAQSEQASPTSDSPPQSPGAETTQVANVVRRVAYDSGRSPAAKSKHGSGSSRSPSPRKSRRRPHRRESASPTPGLIQQIVTEKLHKVMADLLKARKAQADWTQTNPVTINVPITVPEADDTLNIEQSNRSEFCLNDCTVLEPANSSSDTTGDAAPVKSKPKSRKVATKSRRRSSQPRYASSTVATTRRRQLARQSADASATNHPNARSSSPNSTPDSGARSSRRNQYVSKLLR